MANTIDITNKKFNRLTAIRIVGKDKWRQMLWLCKCDCGNEVIVDGYGLRNNRTKSCGCLQREAAKKSQTTHGLRYTPLNAVWNSMKQRCGNPKNKNFNEYGARGIKVCEEWLQDFKLFYDWAINNGYKKSLTLERRNNNKGYYPENCRWTHY